MFQFSATSAHRKMPATARTLFAIFSPDFDGAIPGAKLIAVEYGCDWIYQWPKYTVRVQLVAGELRAELLHPADRVTALAGSHWDESAADE